MRSQVNFYGETNGLFTHLVSATSEHSETNDNEDQHQEQTKDSSNTISKVKSDQEFQEDLDQQLSALRGLSIVGK